MAESKNDIVRCGLIQCSNPINDESVPVADIQKAMWRSTFPSSRKPRKRAFRSSASRRSSTVRISAPAKTRAGTTRQTQFPAPTHALSEYAKKYDMVIVASLYEKADRRGVYFGTAAVIDADGTYLGKYRKQHIPQVAGFWEKFFFTPGDGGYPVFDTKYAKVGVYISTTVTSPKVHGASASTARRLCSTHPRPWLAEPVPLEARAARARCR